MNKIKVRKIRCQNSFCGKIIGYLSPRGRTQFYDGTYQIGFNSYCGEKCAKKDKALPPK